VRPIHACAIPLACGVCHGRFARAGTGKATPGGRPRKTRNRLASNNGPLAILAGTARKTISRTISRKPIRASRPLCKVHGAVVVVVQVAMPVYGELLFRPRLQPVHGEFAFKRQLAVQTTRGNGFGKHAAQVWPAAGLGGRLSPQVCRRPALGAPADRYNTFGIAPAFAPSPLHSKRADDPRIPFGRRARLRSQPPSSA
jgi:hypothetical protein